MATQPVKTEIIRIGELTDQHTIVLANGTLPINGEVYESNIVKGLLVVETEVGSVYMDPDGTIEVEA